MKNTIKLLFCLVIFSVIFSQRTVSPESRVFSETKNQVFTIFGKSGHGSGFLINDDGLILTNSHVLGDNVDNITVKLNSEIKVKAVLVDRDTYKDLAVIAINPALIKSLNLKSLKLATRSDTMIFEGERVIAIGSPLNQERILTSGIVSRYDNKVIMHDVNINPGNSGGPLINMNAEVIGVNTFGDISDRGPGIYGSVNILEADDIIKSSYFKITNSEIEPYHISTMRLPVMPTDIFPLKALEDAVNKEYPESIYHLITASKFELWILTPPLIYGKSKQREKRLASKRTDAAGDNRYELYSDLKDWGASVGRNAPVVKLIVDPKVGETTASAVSNACAAGAAGYAGTTYYSNQTFEFKADVEKVQVFKNGEENLPIISNYVYTTLDFNVSNYSGRAQGEDMAQKAIITLPIEFFLPDENDVFGEYSIRITDYRTGKTFDYIIPMNTIYKINDDFYPYTKNDAGTKLYKSPSGACS